MTPDAFVSEMLAQIHREFFRTLTDKQFFQERSLLKQAVTFPASHMQERFGAALPLIKYQQIIKTVIEAIRKHGNRNKIERFSAYFLHCVQEHMLHHGDSYYNEAKNLAAGRRVSSVVSEAMKGIRPGYVDDTKALAAAHVVLRSKGGRRKRLPQSQIQLI